LPQSPTAYSPFSGHKYYIDRTQSVLTQMVNDGYAAKSDADSALKEIKNYQFSQHDVSIKAPHFVMYVREKLAEQFGSDQAVETGGFQVRTTLDYEIQKKTEEIVKSEIEKLKTYHV